MPSSLMAAPVAPFQPPPVPAPSLPPIGTFPGTAPTPTPYGAFVAPDPANYEHDPGFQANVDFQQKGLQRSAAAHGSLLSGGLLGRLQANASRLASEDYGNVFNRSLASYTAGRDTAAQNFGQSMQQFQGNLGAFGANTTAALGAGRLAQDATFGTYDRNYGAARDQQANQQHVLDRNTATANDAADAYAEQVAQQNADARRLNAAQNAAPRPVSAQNISMPARLLPPRLYR